MLLASFMVLCCGLVSHMHLILVTCCCVVVRYVTQAGVMGWSSLLAVTLNCLWMILHHGLLSSRDTSTRWLTNLSFGSVQMSFLPIFSVAISLYTYSVCFVQSVERHNNNNNHFTALWLGLFRWAGTRRNIYSLTPIINHFWSASSIYYDFCPIYVPGSLFAQPLSKSSLVYLFVWTLQFISYSIYFFTQSLCSFRNTCPYKCNLFCCGTNIMFSIPCLSTLYLELYLLL